MNKYKTLILFIAIILIAASLRLYRINQLGTFLADQAIELEGTYQILQGKFTLIGIKTSVSEIRNGAVMYYNGPNPLFIEIRSGCRRCISNRSSTWRNFTDLSAF